MDDTDHYVCTFLPHGGRVQVGPITLEGARLLAERIKHAARPSVAYNTWIDWRRLDQFPLLDINAFYAEIMGSPRVQPRQPPTLPLGQYSDRILIEELKRRGFMVPKKSHVCDLTCQEVYLVHEYEVMARNPEWLDSARNLLARRIGVLLLHNHAVGLETLAGDFGETVLRMRAVAIAPEARHA